MTSAEILEQLGALSLSERLSVLETALHRLREELVGRPDSADAPTPEERLLGAADALREDYESDPDLTAFTALDGEPVHEAG